MITANIASHLPVIAEQQPDTYAVVVQAEKKQAKPSYKTAYTYQQLNQQSDVIASGLKQYGIERGTRVVLMVQPGLDFFALVFALFKLGSVLVAVDPGMGIKNLGKCLKEAEPEAFIGNLKANSARVILSWAKNTINKTVLVGGNVLTNQLIINLDEIKLLGKTASHNKDKKKHEIKDETQAEDMAAILFTSGSTGIPKGVVYTHANFTAQVQALKKLYNIEPGEIDLATFPLFGLFAPALGMTSIIPKMDFTKPGSVEPTRIIDAVNHYKCTTMFGSPALLNRVGQWAENKEIKLPSLKRVLSAGAPVTTTVLSRFKRLLNNETQIFTPYGATESLPVSSIGSDEIIKETAKATIEGKGVCVGKTVAGLDIRIIKISDEIISEWSDELELAANQIGEICVKGPQVTRSYFNRSKETGLAKIQTDNGFYHRMGDLGYMDEKGKLWFCGRKSHRVITESETLFTVCCEAIFNTHTSVFRSALVSAKNKSRVVPVICIELEKGKKHNEVELIEELLAIAKKSELTKNIEHVLFHKSFPVDIRHNAKIGREKLADWATEVLF